MCLRIVKSTIDEPDAEGVGYVRRHDWLKRHDGPRLAGPYRNQCRYRLKWWYIATGALWDHLPYPFGFHVFSSLTSARKFQWGNTVIVRAKWRHRVAVGYETGFGTGRTLRTYIVRQIKHEEIVA